MSNLIEIAQNATPRMGVDLPDRISGSTKREHQEILEYLNAVGEDLTRRVDWGTLTKEIIVPGTGNAGAVTIANDLHRLAQRTAVIHNGAPLRALTRAEWNTLTFTEGTPRYYLLEGKEISLWPYLSLSDSVKVFYQSINWCDNGTNEFRLDEDAPLVPSELFELGLIYRWKRQKGLPYTDFENEYEASLNNYASFDDNSRLQ